MSWKNDMHGLVFASNELKLYRNGEHTWAMKLSQLANQTGTVRIVTYSLPTLGYVMDQILRRPHDIWMICNTKFKREAEMLKRKFPYVRIAIHERTHSKICMIAPATLYIGSANFGVSRWHETEIGVRSAEAHDWYVENSFTPLWAESIEIT